MPLSDRELLYGLRKAITEHNEAHNDLPVIKVGERKSLNAVNAMIRADNALWDTYNTLTALWVPDSKDPE